MDVAEQSVLKGHRPAQNWGGLAGGTMILLALAVLAAQFHEAYQFGRRPWIISCHQGLSDAFGLLLMRFSPILLCFGLIITGILLAWATYRRRIGDAICSIFAMLIWTTSFVCALPSYAGRAGALALVQDTRFNRAIGAEMWNLYRQRRGIRMRSLPADLAPDGMLSKKFPLLAKLHPEDIWLGRHGLSVIFGSRQLYSLRVKGAPGSVGGGGTPGSAVLYFRMTEDGQRLPVAVFGDRLPGGKGRQADDTAALPWG